MRIRQLTIKNYGPFRKYAVGFPEEDNPCVLLTGKNNEGKSSIISALKLVHASTRVVGKNRYRLVIERDEYFKLLQQDTEDILIPRMVHNYADEKAELIAEFSGGFKITVYLDPGENIIYADYEGRMPDDLERIFGFIPPLGPLSEQEDLVVNESYLRASLHTSLAPRHLRNHLAKLLTMEEFDLVKQIINSSWEGIELLNYEVRHDENQITCYYREGRIDREISWAGQGLQVWFQIIAHFVRLRDSRIMIFDEPEINLHPEKQNELIRIIRDRFLGGVIIATHSVELMNNVNVSHILNVQKKSTGPKVKSTDDRAYLEIVRSQIGSNFNLVASQFEDCDLIVFTEDVFDFSILRELAETYGIKSKTFNIPIHGFSEFPKAIHYKDAYRILIGKDVKYSMLLDKDYYPTEYLDTVKEKLKKAGILVRFTYGKEIENVFLTPQVINRLIPAHASAKFAKQANALFKSERVDAWGSFSTLHKQFLPSKLDIKTITSKYMPQFEEQWDDADRRWQMIPGKRALSWLRDFVKKESTIDLPIRSLAEHLVATGDAQIFKLVKAIYRC